MTVQTNTNVASFLGNGAATYPIGFKFNSAADLVVQKTVIATGVTTTLTLNSDYSVAGAGVEEGGSITFSQAPTSAESIKVTRVVDLLQLTDLRNQGKFYAEVHEEVFDKLVMIDQQQQTEIDDANEKSDEAVAIANAANAKSDQAVASAAQNLVDMQAQYDAFEQGASLVIIGDYAPGLVVDGYNKAFRKDGEFYRAKAETTLPYPLNGDWAVDAPKFVSVGYAVLRQELAGVEGAGLVGYGDGTVESTLDRLIGIFPTVTKSFGGIGDGVADDTEAVKAALESNRTVIFDGVFKVGPLVITGRIVDARFAPGAKLVFTHTDRTSLEFVDCRGRLDDVVIEDVPDDETAGKTSTIRGTSCKRFRINRGRIVAPKDDPITWFECDDTWADDVIIEGSQTKRPFGCETIGSQNSGFRRCGMMYTDFGFNILGPGYTSGPLVTTRDWKDTLGQKVIDCWVYDHLGHAHNMNGAVGAEIRGCTAINYTGTTDGNPAFQMKNSTNVPEEVSGATRFNWIRDCVAVDQVGGFFAQDASNGAFENNVVINCKRYPISLNKSPRIRVNGLKIRDWGTDLANWPLQNGDTVCGAVNVWANSTNCIIENIEIEVTESHANLGVCVLANIVGARCSLGKVRIQKTIEDKLYAAAVVKAPAANCFIQEGFRPNSPDYYVQRAIIDEATSTIYPRQFGVVLSLSALSTVAMPVGPQRVFSVGKIQVSPVVAPSDAAFSVGRIGSASQLRASGGASSAEQRYDPDNANLTAGEVLSATCSTAGSGSIRIMVLGVDML